MKTLIIPDIHQDYRWAQQKIEQYEHDRLVLLGDYFDTRDETKATWTADTAIWLAELLQQPHVVGLFGNHDTPYLFTRCPGLTCTGTTRERYQKLEETGLLDTLRSKLAWYTQVDGWLLSHAGVHSMIFGDDDDKVSLSLIDERLAEALDRMNPPDDVFKTQLESRNFPAAPWPVAAGQARGGKAPVGGITWLDWSYEFDPVPGFRQIVGHTNSKAGKIRWNGENCCLDNNQTMVAMLNDGELITEL